MVPMHVEAQATLAPALSSAREARSFVRDVVGGDAESEAVVTLELLTSELVTNAVRHAGAGPLVVVARRGPTVRVLVEDPSPRWPQRHDPPPLAVSGRGVALVDVLSSSWGIERLRPRGKRVWFEVPVEPPAGTLGSTVSRLGGRGQAKTWSRKVGAPQGKVLVNGQSG